MIKVEVKWSNSSVNTHQKLKAILDANQEVLSIVNVDIEFPLQGIVHVDASLDADLIVLTVPVCFVSNWYSIPSIWVKSPKSWANASNDTFSKHVWLINNRFNLKSKVDLPLVVNDGDWRLGNRIP